MHGSNQFLSDGTSSQSNHNAEPEMIRAKGAAVVTVVEQGRVKGAADPAMDEKTRAVTSPSTLALQCKATSPTKKLSSSTGLVWPH